ncbi:MAG: hypothetical protein J5I50_06555 [Chitinophagaceae bacterium]|nr:hypothetical protein [Chitinophagaceae bacterium]
MLRRGYAAKRFERGVSVPLYSTVTKDGHGTFDFTKYFWREFATRAD